MKTWTRKRIEDPQESRADEEGGEGAHQHAAVTDKVMAIPYPGGG
jgi:hypothetical protein